jgi:hypothetical protein
MLKTAKQIAQDVLTKMAVAAEPPIRIGKVIGNSQSAKGDLFKGVKGSMGGTSAKATTPSAPGGATSGTL